MARHVRSTFVAFLFLVLSHTAMVTKAQQAALGNATGLPANSSSEAVAKLLANVFAGLSLDLATLGGTNATATSGRANGTAKAGATAAAAGDAFRFNLTGINATAIPNLMRLINVTTANGPAPGALRIGQAIQQALVQQQSAGNLLPLENAAATVSAFLNLPSTFGTGANIQQFVSRVEAVRGLRDQVKSYLNIDQLRQINGYINTAAALGLQALAAYPVAQLAFMAANLALASAILGLLGGIFYAVASALAVAATIPGVANLGSVSTAEAAATAAPARRSGAAASGNATAVAGLLSADWVNTLKKQALAVQEPILRFAFSQKPLGGLRLAENLMDLASGAIGVLAPPGAAASA